MDDPASRPRRSFLNWFLGGSLGAVGVKISKGLGLGYSDAAGRLCSARAGVI